MTDEKAVLYEVQDGIATICLNRPDRMNAMNNALMQGISDAVNKVREDHSVRVVVLTGAGRGFCAGADLQQVANDNGAQQSNSNDSEQLGGTFNRALVDLMECPVPTVAKVNGAAAGGGFGLALACDVSIAAHSAFFVATFGPNLGIVPDMGTTWNLPLRVGRARALGLALLGERIPATKAEQWGLIWSAVADAELDERVAEIAEVLKRSSPDASVRIRDTINAANHNSFPEQLDLEMAHQAVLIPKNMREGARAFLQKRTPQFEGVQAILVDTRWAKKLLVG